MLLLSIRGCSLLLQVAIQDLDWPSRTTSRMFYAVLVVDLSFNTIIFLFYLHSCSLYSFLSKAMQMEGCWTDHIAKCSINSQHRYGKC